MTRGPGATNASIGVHTAMQDSAPMILFVGQVGTDMKGCEAFQEVDYKAVFGTGGLADVAGALPIALAGHDMHMRTLMPGYSAVMQRLASVEVVAEIEDLLGQPAGRALCGDGGYLKGGLRTANQRRRAS